MKPSFYFILFLLIASMLQAQNYGAISPENLSALKIADGRLNVQ